MRCKETSLKFKDDEFLADGNCGKITRGVHVHMWYRMPPVCTVVIATAQYMQEYQLDSWNTTYELDRQLNIEAREQKELEIFQHYRRNA